MGCSGVILLQRHLPSGGEHIPERSASPFVNNILCMYVSVKGDHRFYEFIFHTQFTHNYHNNLNEP